MNGDVRFSRWVGQQIAQCVQLERAEDTDAAVQRNVVGYHLALVESGVVAAGLLGRWLGRRRRLRPVVAVTPDDLYVAGYFHGMIAAALFRERARAGLALDDADASELGSFCARYGGALVAARPSGVGVAGIEGAEALVAWHEATCRALLARGPAPPTWEHGALTRLAAYVGVPMTEGVATLAAEQRSARRP